MNFKRNRPLDVLDLAKRLKNSTETFEKDLSKFEELFAFPFKITVSMKKVMSEILNQKEITYSYKTAEDKVFFLSRKSNDEKKIELFNLYNIKETLIGYDKFTFLSNKEYFYVCTLEHVGTVVVQDEKVQVQVINNDYYEGLVKLSRNINEYYETEVIVSDEYAVELEPITFRKTSIDDLIDKKTYFEKNSKAGDLMIYVETMLKMVNEEHTPERINFYTATKGAS